MPHPGEFRQTHLLGTNGSVATRRRIAQRLTRGTATSMTGAIGVAATATAASAGRASQFAADGGCSFENGNG